MICNYDRNTAFQCAHLPYRSECAGFLRSPTLSDIAELPSSQEFSSPSSPCTTLIPQTIKRTQRGSSTLPKVTGFFIYRNILLLILCLVIKMGT